MRLSSFFVFALLSVATVACRAQEIAHPQERPPVTAVARFNGAPKESYELQIGGDGVIYVSVLVNGKPATFMLNSLWGIDALTVDAAKRLGVETFAGTDLTAPSAKIDRLQIGGFELDNDLVTIQPSAGWKADGLLGFGFFSQAVVGIHWDTKRMTVTDPARFTPPPVATSVPLILLPNRCPVVAGNLDGLDGRFQLELGQDGNLELNPGWVAHYHVREKYFGDSTQDHTGVDEFNAGSFQIGSFSLKRPQIDVGKPDPSAPYDIAGRIGDTLLEGMDETVDYTHKAVFFEKNELGRKAEREAKPSFAPLYVEANKSVGTLSQTALADKQRLAGFEAQFVKLTNDTGPVTAYAHFCTSDFAVTTWLSGKVQDTLTRTKLLDLIRQGGPSPDPSTGGPQMFSPFMLLGLTRSAESHGGSDEDGGKLTYSGPDKYETKGAQIVYSEYPVLAMGTGPGSANMRMTVVESFVPAGKELRLKSIDITDFHFTVNGKEIPQDDLKEMFAGNFGDPDKTKPADK